MKIWGWVKEIQSEMFRAFDGMKVYIIECGRALQDIISKLK